MTNIMPNPSQNNHSSLFNNVNQFDAIFLGEKELEKDPDCLEGNELKNSIFETKMAMKIQELNNFIRDHEKKIDEQEIMNKKAQIDIDRKKLLIRKKRTSIDNMRQIVKNLKTTHK
jgi:hypothetical protein